MDDMGSVRALEAPGLKRMKRHNGRIDCYWVADEKLVKQGYPTKTVRLFGDPADPSDFAQMASKCRMMRSEMLQWASGVVASGNRSPRGTVAWICDAFETDPESPFHGLRRDTQLFYSSKLAIIKDTVGSRLLRELNGKDFRRWFKEWGRFDEKTQAFGAHRRGYACIQTLRRVVSYHCEDGGDIAFRLAGILEHIEFKNPKGRQLRPSAEQIAAVVAKAREMNRPSIAVAVMLQFALALRQKDAIGEWVPDTGTSREGIRDGSWRWQMGLTWAHVSPDMILSKPTSKSNGGMVAAHDLKAHPDLLAALMEIPRERRIGPIIIDEGSGKPWRRSHFSRTFRKIATAAGWPKELWNMDSRAGAISDAFEQAADPADVMKVATHTQLSTTMGYNRGAVVQTNRVAKLRNEPRTGRGNSHGNT